MSAYGSLGPDPTVWRAPVDYAPPLAASTGIRRRDAKPSQASIHTGGARPPPGSMVFLCCGLRGQIPHRGWGFQPQRCGKMPQPLLEVIFWTILTIDFTSSYAAVKILSEKGTGAWFKS